MTAAIPGSAWRNDSRRGQKPPLKSGLTLWLFFPTVALVAALFVGFCWGSIPWWVNWMLAAPCYYFLIICAHDALHGCAHRKQRGNDAVGWIGTQLFCIPYPVVRRAHLSHHAREGAPDDIERFAYDPGPTLPLRIVFGNWMYYRHLPKCNRVERGLAAVTVIGTLALLLAFPRESMLGWALPMQTGTAYIFVTTVWIPHGPYSRWWMDHFPFVTGFHEDHHAQPRYPFHQISQKAIRAYGRTPIRRLLAAGRRTAAV